jgi:transposase
MKKRLLKQVVGIDVAQDELVITLGRMHDDLVVELYGSKTFENNLKGFKAMLAWVSKLTESTVPVHYVMEATGVYHESCAYFLDENEQLLSVVLPNKISNFIRTLECKTVNDHTCAEAIARFGLERKLEKWKRPRPIFKKLRQLTRERDQLVNMRTITKNQLHAEQAEAEPNKSSLMRLKKQVDLFNKQEKEIKTEIEQLIKTDQEVRKNVQLICTIKGVGILTAATILAETNGFELIRNRRQLASYAGFDIIEKQSGTSIRGKKRISKRGNKYLRKAMHMPALAALRSNENFRALYARLVGKHGIKMKAAVAVQRKLLELTYTIYKTGKAFDMNHVPHKTDKTLMEI